MQKKWHKDNNMHAMHLEVLQLMMKESIQIVENIETSTQHQKADVKLKIRDLQINRLKEQIIFRDELIDEARTMLHSAGVRKLQDNRIAPFEDIIYENQIILRNREVQNSRLNNNNNNNNQALNFNGKGYGSNPANNRKQVSRMFASNNNNYIDRAERLE